MFIGYDNDIGHLSAIHCNATIAQQSYWVNGVKGGVLQGLGVGTIRKAMLAAMAAMRADDETKVYAFELVRVAVGTDTTAPLESKIQTKKVVEKVSEILDVRRCCVCVV